MRNLFEELPAAVLTFLDSMSQLEFWGMDSVGRLMDLPDSITFEFKYFIQDFLDVFVKKHPEKNLSDEREPILLFPERLDLLVLDKFGPTVYSLADLLNEMHYDRINPIAALMELNNIILDDFAYIMAKYIAREVEEDKMCCLINNNF